MIMQVVVAEHDKRLAKSERCGASQLNQHDHWREEAELKEASDTKSPWQHFQACMSRMIPGVETKAHASSPKQAPGSFSPLSKPAVVQQSQARRQLPKRANTHQDHSSNRILGWVNRLERINANPDNPSSSCQQHHDHSTTNCNIPSATRISIKSLAPAVVAAVGVPIDGVNNSKEGDQDDVCFKTAQLATEFLLMLFAATLLIIAAIVILSKKIPAFMESYEIVPKVLFFLCLFVAVYSFARWIIVKIRSNFHLMNCYHRCKRPSSAGRQTVRLQREKPLASEDHPDDAAPSGGEQTMRESDLQQRPPLSEPEDHQRGTGSSGPSGAATGAGAAAQDGGRPQRQPLARFGHAHSCPPPTRQLAFDSPNLTPHGDDTIAEESERSFASA